MNIEMRIACPWTNIGSSTCVMAWSRPSAGAVTPLTRPLRVAKEVRHPEREDRERERHEPERPGSHLQGRHEGGQGDDGRDGDEGVSFAREVHDRGVPVMRR